MKTILVVPMTTRALVSANPKHLARTGGKVLWLLRYQYKSLFRIPIQHLKLTGNKLSWRGAKFNRQIVYFTAASQRVHAIFTGAAVVDLNLSFERSFVSRCLWGRAWPEGASAVGQSQQIRHFRRAARRGGCFLRQRTVAYAHLPAHAGIRRRPRCAPSPAVSGPPR